ncbi:hypothetical protein [Alkalihalobacillus sp. TS-13]|uniref:hypothetical protein n=1 Tax=Alkalihalobacillus sp. TS-13 TaxID=2842455 RepID=UPI001C88DD60|nr:hypothetical protein [Alkalihalobacillus sp. TS-13]
MFKRIMALLIGYFSLYTVVNDIPTSSYDQFMGWVAKLIMNPMVFVYSAFLILIGVIAYGIALKTIITDFRNQRLRSLIVQLLYIVLVICSVYLLYQMNELLMLIFLPCSVIYGIISLSQFNVHERRQEGAE